MKPGISAVGFAIAATQALAGSKTILHCWKML